MTSDNRKPSKDVDLNTQAGRAAARRASIMAKQHRPRVADTPTPRTARPTVGPSNDIPVPERAASSGRGSAGRGSSGRGSAGSAGRGASSRGAASRTAASQPQAKDQRPASTDAPVDAREAARARVAARTSGASQTRGPESGVGTLVANRTPLIIAAIALVAIFALAMLMRSCQAQPDETEGQDVADTVQPAIDVSTTYDWSNLTRNNGRYAYSIDGEVVSKFGVDVSENNAEINWPAAAADGVEFAFIRVGYRGNEEGNIHPDSRFEENLKGARDAEIAVGLYFYSQAITEEEAREEARYCIDKIEGTELEYPIAFDSETHPEINARTDSVPRGELAKVAAAFCEEVKAAGYKPLIYGSSNDLARYKRDDLAAYPVWYAEYGGLPDPPSGFTFWQFHRDALVGGFEGEVDVNLDLTEAAKILASQPDAQKSDTATESEAESDQQDTEKSDTEATAA